MEHLDLLLLAIAPHLSDDDRAVAREELAAYFDERVACAVDAALRDRERTRAIVPRSTFGGSSIRI